MQAPKIINTRFPHQAEILLNKMSIPFKGSRVLDLGCGFGDMVFFAANNGARSVVGVEQNEMVFEELQKRFLECENHSVIRLEHKNIDAFIKKTYRFDIAICFSVLPYMSNPVQVLRWMGRNSKYVYVECQYAGDGPGYENIENDAHFLKEYLLPAGLNGKVIGKTLVEYRNKHRSIWELQRTI